MNSEEHVIELLAGYALGCIEPDEEHQVAQHLRSCAVCRVELEAYRLVVADLSLATVQHAPAPELKTRLMARAAASGGSGRHLEQSPPKKARPSFWERPALWAPLPRRLQVWGLASLVLTLALGLGNLYLLARLNRQTPGPGSAPDPGLVTVPMLPTENNPGAGGLLVLSMDGAHGTLVVDGLPVVTEAEQYQLWLIRDGERTDGGVFSVDRRGYGSMWVHADEPLDSFDSFGVTLEPAGGSPGPTGPKVLGGEL